MLHQAKKVTAAVLLAVMSFFLLPPPADAVQKKVSMTEYLQQGSYLMERCPARVYNPITRSLEYDPIYNPSSKQMEYRCADGSMSYHQPGINGVGGTDWGLCGPTAVANAVCMTCGFCRPPEHWIPLTGVRTGGGTRPQDLLNALNSEEAQRVCQNRKWVLLSSPSPGSKRNVLDLLENMLRGGPVITFLRTGTEFHAVTVTRFVKMQEPERSTIGFVTWGRRYLSLWPNFKQAWDNSEYLVISLDTIARF